MLHPVGIITIGIVLASVSTARFFAVSGSNRSLGTKKGRLVSILKQFERTDSGVMKSNLRASQEISEFKGFDKVGVPDHAAVLSCDIRKCLINSIDLSDTIVQTFLSSENADVRLHSLLHIISDLKG